MKQKPEHLDKVFWPEKGYTKADLLEYYKKASVAVLPYLKDRPTALNRYPEGIRGLHFFQKNLGNQELPRFVKTANIRAASTGKQVTYALVQNKETLLYLASLGSIEMHPWASRTAHLAKPDYLVFDLDPGTRSTFDDVVRVAQTIRKVLESVGVKSICKTSGKRGLHVYAPLGARYEYKKVREFARRVSQKVSEQLPGTTTLEQRIAKRKGRVYLDYTRNSTGQTVVCAYSLRPTPLATVSTPLLWSEVKKGLNPKKFTIKTIFKRLKQKGDLWKPVLDPGVNLTRAMKRLDTSA
jgi:bifunctional non-homologous end joining protein LigD